MKLTAIVTFLVVSSMVAAAVPRYKSGGSPLQQRDAIINGEDYLVYRASVPSTPSPTSK
jgi:hypothetical protein